MLMMLEQVGDGPNGRAVSLQAGQVAVLAGHTLEFATGGALRATHHRVVVRRSPTSGFQRLLRFLAVGSVLRLGASQR